MNYLEMVAALIATGMPRSQAESAAQFAQMSNKAQSVAIKAAG